MLYLAEILWTTKVIFVLLFSFREAQNLYKGMSLSIPKLRHKLAFQSQAEQIVQAYRTARCFVKIFTYLTFLCKIYIVYVCNFFQVSSATARA